MLLLFSIKGCYQMKLPSFQFYPGDWRKDPNLSRCSHTAKGVWMDMLCLMFECEERGILATDGAAWSKAEIAQAIGGDQTVTLQAIDELLRKGVARLNRGGAIFSARMVRDELNRQAARERVARFRAKGGDEPPKDKDPPKGGNSPPGAKSGNSSVTATVTPKKRKSNTYSSSSSSPSVSPSGVNTHRQSAPVRGSPSGEVCVLSRHSLETCLKWALYLHDTRQGIINPRGYARAIYEDGRDDDRIDEWLNTPTEVVTFPTSSGYDSQPGTVPMPESELEELAQAIEALILVQGGDVCDLIASSGASEEDQLRLLERLASGQVKKASA
jgi:hypothetical protein